MKRKNYFGLNQPLAHSDHRRPVTRREFVSQGFAFGSGLALGAPLATSLLLSPNANALSPDLQQYLRDFGCGAFDADNAKIPFICFDLAGGANIAGSNVLVGTNTQRDTLDSSGYLKQGLPADMVPDGSTSSRINDEFGLLFHEDSQMLRGIRESAVAASSKTNGAVIAARSENDTGNNPHNPMYAINKYATSVLDGNGLTGERSASGRLLSLIGSRSSESGANSMAPLKYIEPEYRPTKIDRPSDATGLVDTGELVNLLGKADTEVIMESIYRLSAAKLGTVTTGTPSDSQIKNLVRCGYLNAASNSEQSPSDLNADDRNLDTDTDIPMSKRGRVIVGDESSIFTEDEFDGDREFRKTASIMKLVINGYAGAGTISMGGYDYHTGDRATGEIRDLRAGRCIGACLDYARRVQKPVMIYVYSDGSVFSNGMVDNSENGRGKGVWTGDNQQTAASFFLVYDPIARPEPIKQQIGAMTRAGNVDTASSPVANNVDALVDAVTLNYMALHGEQGNFQTIFGPTLGNRQAMDELIAFNPIPSRA